jgi:aspartyl protease family protein
MPKLVEVFFIASALWTADPELPSVLKEAGLVESATTFVLEDERTFRTKLTQAKPLVKRLLDAESKYKDSRRDADRQADQFEQMKTRERDLRRMLDVVPDGDVDRHNQIVREINSLVANLNDYQQNRSNDGDDAPSKRAYEVARGEYLKAVADLKSLSTTIEERYAELADDADVQAAIEEWNQDREKKYELGPSRSFQTDLKSLGKLADRVQEQSMTVRSAGNVYFIEVRINDRAQTEFIVDTGASVISIPQALADEAGVDASAGEPIKISIANGEEMSARLVRLDKVKVGDFELAHVECAVVDQAYPDAPKLLGNSFLGQFSHRIDPDGPTLVLTQLQANANDADKPKSSRKRRKKSE